MSAWPYNTAAWQALRDAKLTANPLCEACIRREVVEVARAVDHIIAIAAGGPAFPSIDGLMSLCISCHNSKTNAKDHPLATGFRRAFKGCDADGNPIDPEGWEPLPAASAARPGGLEGRPIRDAGPGWESNADLVFANDSQLEDDRWV